MTPDRRHFLTSLARLGLVLPGGEALAQGFAGLGRTAEGFETPKPGKVLVFPQDHGGHPKFRTEWWYLTANLEGDDGAAYGAQWTLFRQAQRPGPQPQGWANPQIFMGHAAATSANAHEFAQTSARGGVGAADVTVPPFRAFIDDWRFDAEAGGDGLAKARVLARSPLFSFDLDIEADGPLLLHGDAGYSRKSAAGQASFYVSQPHLEVAGALALHGALRKVRGRAWMDHEWSSQPLAAGQKGWDWFALHLPNNEKLMLFRLRSDDAPPFLSGTFAGASGAARPLGPVDFTLTPLSETRIAGRVIPTRWRIGAPALGLDIETQPLNPACWNASTFAYWEGPLRFSGSHAGVGYLEMTGY